MPQGEFALVTDADLERARVDRTFRHQLLATSLELLLKELNKLRGLEADAARARQLCEGVALAVQLADRLQRIALTQPGGARAA
jgi:hypothetical protein